MILCRNCHFLNRTVCFLVRNRQSTEISKRFSSTSSSSSQTRQKSCLVTWPNGEEIGQKVKNDFLQQITKLKREVIDIYGCKSLYPFPFALTQHQIDEFKRIQEAIQAALKCTIRAYTNDSRIQRVYEFDSKTKFLLSLYDNNNNNTNNNTNKPYEHVGLYR